MTSFAFSYVNRLSLCMTVRPNHSSSTSPSPVILKTAEDTKAGLSLSDAFSKHPEMPGIIVQMTRVGEESGDLGSILKNLAKFYQRELLNTVDTLIGLIEPMMIVLLGLGVGFLLASVLIPIYNVSAGL